MNNKFFIIIIIFLIPFFAFAQRNKIHVGLKEELYNMDLEKSIYNNFFVDLVEYIAEQENWQVSFYSYHNSNDQNEEDTINYDLLIEPISNKNPSKKLKVSKESIISTWAKVYTNENMKMETVLDMNDKSIGVIESSAYYKNIDSILKSYNISADIVAFKNIISLKKGLEKGWIDAAVIDRLDDTDLLSKGRIHPTSIIFAPISYHFKTKKNEELLKTIESHLTIQKNNPDSYYFHLLNELLGVEKRIKEIPKQVIWVLVILIAVAAVLFSDNYRIKKQVSMKTMELKQNNDRLRNEVAKRIETESALRDAKVLAEAANQAKSEFLANMSHEIRTPMNAIIGFTDLISHHVIDRDGKEYARSIKTSGKTLLSLINNILDLSKIESGKMKIKREYVDLNILFTDIKLIFEKQIEQKKLDHRFIYDNPSFQLLYLDEIRIKQILINLIGNAIKFTDKGQIKVSLQINKKGEKNKSDLIMIIEDTGIGIPESHHKSVFESFTQKDGKSTRKYEGTGLGLAICKNLVNIMQGQIELESVENKGSKFRIIFKDIDSRTGNDLDKSEQVNIPQVTFRNQNILIVDDIKSNRVVLTKILEKYNLSVNQAKSGKEAIEFVKQNKPDIILMDLKMPEMDGITASQIITSEPENKQIPIMALSASMKNDHNIDSLEIFKQFLTKPVVTEELIATIQLYLKHDISTPISAKTKEKYINEELPSEIIDTLVLSYIPKIKDLQEHMIIDDIFQFANQLHELGVEYKSDRIINISEKLIDSCSIFNIEDINNSLSDLASCYKNYMKNSIG